MTTREKAMTKRMQLNELETILEGLESRNEYYTKEIDRYSHDEDGNLLDLDKDSWRRSQVEEYEARIRAIDSLYAVLDKLI